MVNLGNDEIVKYPFLAEAGKYLSDKGFSPEQFGTDPDLKKIVDNAFQVFTRSPRSWFAKELDLDEVKKLEKSLKRQILIEWQRVHICHTCQIFRHPKMRDMKNQ